MPTGRAWSRACLDGCSGSTPRPTTAYGATTDGGGQIIVSGRRRVSENRVACFVSDDALALGLAFYQRGVFLGGYFDRIRRDSIAVDFARVEAACCFGIEHFFSLVADGDDPARH